MCQNKKITCILLKINLYKLCIFRLFNVCLDYYNIRINRKRHVEFRKMADANNHVNLITKILQRCYFRYNLFLKLN